MTTILENANGVRITEGGKMHGHYVAEGALCCCGEHLIVAPMIFHADHRKGDPVMVCGDHGIIRWSLTSSLSSETCSFKSVISLRVSLAKLLTAVVK